MKVWLLHLSCSYIQFLCNLYSYFFRINVCPFFFLGFMYVIHNLKIYIFQILFDFI